MNHAPEDYQLALATRESQIRLGLKPQTIEEILEGKPRNQGLWRARKAIRVGGAVSPSVIKNRLTDTFQPISLRAIMGPNATIAGSLPIILVERLQDQTPAKVALAAFVLMHLSSRLRLGSCEVDASGAPQIADAVRQQASTIHKLLDRLEDADFICRIPGTRPARLLLNPQFVFKARSADFSLVSAEWEAGKLERDEKRSAMGRSRAGRPKADSATG